MQFPFPTTIYFSWFHRHYRLGWITLPLLASSRHRAPRLLVLFFGVENVVPVLYTWFCIAADAYSTRWRVVFCGYSFPAVGSPRELHCWFCLLPAAFGLCLPFGSHCISTPPACLRSGLPVLPSIYVLRFLFHSVPHRVPLLTFLPATCHHLYTPATLRSVGEEDSSDILRVYTYHTPAPG